VEADLAVTHDPLETEIDDAEGRHGADHHDAVAGASRRAQFQERVGLPRERKRGLARTWELFAATNEMCGGTPGVMRQRLETPHGVDADNRLAGRQSPVRDCAQRPGAVGAAQVDQCFRAALQPDEGLLGRRRGCVACGVG